MHMQHVIPTLCQLYRHQIATGERYCVELVGGPGIGKSECIHQVAARLAHEPLPPIVRPFFLSTVEPPDVRGFALPDRETRTMYFTAAPWMPAADEPAGILLLDEFRQAAHDVQKPAAELLLAGRVGDSELPIAWMVIAASNRESDRSGVQRSLAFIDNRRIEIAIEPHLDSWISWAQTIGDVPWVAVAFARAYPGVVFRDTVPDKPGPFCTPRSFVKMSRLLDTDFDDAVFLELATGLIGEGAAAQFAAFRRVAAELPGYEEIVAAPDTCRLPAIDRPDAQYATVQMIAHRVTAGTTDPAFAYLLRLPKEFQVAGIKAAMTKSGSTLLASPTFAQWLRDNQDLLLAANLLKSPSTGPSK